MKLKSLFILFIFLFFSTINTELHSTAPKELQLTENILLPSEAEADLELHESSSMQRALSEFQRKGGTFVRLGSPQSGKTFQLNPGDAVYPICSAGFCRSQTLWAILRPYRGKILLFPPVGARYGFDPYNGKINWNLNNLHETVYDEFIQWAGEPKATRFGFEQFGHWKGRETVTSEELRQVQNHFDVHYFGPESNWQGQKGQRRVYMAFDRNTHVILHRLNQTNENLEGVVVVHFPYRDLVSNPLPEWKTFKMSAIAYEEFSRILMAQLDLDSL